MKVLLASSSDSRKELLQRLKLDFDSFSPNVDETELFDESPQQLVTRLSEKKQYMQETNTQIILL